jgi:hypothetical protein
LDFIGKAADVGEVVLNKNLPGLSVGSAAFAQSYRDMGKGYNPPQLMTHGVIVVAESYATSLAVTAFSTAAISIISGPPGWIIGGVTAIVVIVTADYGFSNYNEKVLFPASDKLFK